MFFTRKKPIKSDEYLELFKMFEALRISFEAMKLDFDLCKKKLRAKKGLIDEETEKNINDVILPER